MNTNQLIARILWGIVAVVLVTVFCMTLTSCATTTPQVTPQVQKLEITVNGADVEATEKEVISKSMSIDNPGLQFSRMTKINNNVAYMSLTSVSGWDLENLWLDLKLLESMDIKKIVIFMSNPGGAAFQGLGIHDELRIMQNQGFDIEIQARGLIASAAVPILAVGKRKLGSKNCILMIHKAKMFKWGAFSEGLDDLQQQASMIELLNDRYASAVADYTKLTKDEVLELLKKTTWYSAEEALKLGFFDELQ